MQKNDTSRLLIDYNKGKIYDLPNVKGNIIIINNSYYYNSLPGIVNNPVAQTMVIDTLIANNRIECRKDSTQLQQNKRRTDSVQKLQTDSLQLKKHQLDSLIKDMQQLQLQLDSVKQTDSLHAYNFSNKTLLNKLDSELLSNKKEIDSRLLAMNAYDVEVMLDNDNIPTIDTMRKKKRLANSRKQLLLTID